ncbi:MAG: bifunctional DNA-formamidopyrimidine glycosylase/DNA-(apurinic or apyrimidinic site) lyase [Actinobacteria bacterium]|nr:bifunctional DNA-formamidopyrimidine glycosylase/DNA-(apurinic or apyrimidinic site) lyase [Actinomycetota bacterium]
MPELPEVETVRRGLAENIIGKKFKEIEVLHSRATSPKSIAPLKSLKGARIKSVNRRGKFLWFELDRPEVLVGHLGMSGQFLIQPKAALDERHLRARFNLGGNDLRFIDQRTFGWVGVEERINNRPTCVQHIAADPFDSEFDLQETISRFLKKKTEIKRALLDQSVMSGVGNIYADEALWRSKMHPETRTEKLDTKRISQLISSATEVMSEALAVGGTSFDDLYINVNGESGYFERSLAVYGQEGEGCPRCGREIRRITFTNRSSHFCPKCQPTPRANGNR